ncbi:MAG: hypothetical protein IJO04_05695 [Oscillospiraceae bacterium]|nr:hypothetical protein [Oscillospiraceae bacterium]
MKVFTTVMKILAAVAAVVGVVYVAATYGDKIVAWAKNLLCRCQCDCCGEECCCEPTDEEADALTDEEAAVEAPAVQAEEADFEG